MSVSIGGTTGITFNDASVQNTAATGFGFKNRIINPAMVIDQRNAGASVTVPASVVYGVDRFAAYGTQASKFTVQQNAGSVTPPAGFKNYLGATVGASANVTVGTNDVFEIFEKIEGYNVADLGFGAAGASTVTVSFWVRSSLTGTFGGGITNSNLTRNYPFTYTISSANTWEQKSVTIAGDTTGTWGTNNGTGITVVFGLGAGSGSSSTANAWNGTTGAILPTGAVKLIETNSATFYITGVQLEKGSTATSFDYRPYGTELALCQRYYIKINNPTANAGYGAIVGGYTTVRSLGSPHCLPVSMRVTGGNVVVSYSNVSLYRIDLSASYPVTSIGGWAGDFSVPSIDIGVASGLTVGTSYIFTILTNGFVSYSAEL